MSLFKRELNKDEARPDILIDPKLNTSGYVGNFGYEWTQIKGLSNREVQTFGTFPMFMLPKGFFKGQSVVDVGCGNGRLGSVIAPDTASYIGVDLSESIYAYPQYIKKPETFHLVRASGTDLPVSDNVADITVSLGVLHHMDDYAKGLDELIRVTKKGGIILLYIYWKYFAKRQSINALAMDMDDEKLYKLLKYLGHELDVWTETDQSFGGKLSESVFYAPSATSEWAVHQWFDGISPRYHWCLTDWIVQECERRGLLCETIVGGVYRIHV